MGHMYPESVSKFMMGQVYAKGHVTMKDLLEAAEKQKIVVSCADGKHGFVDGHEEVLIIAIQELLEYHCKKERFRGQVFPAQLMPVFESDEQREVFGLFMDNAEEFHDPENADPDDPGCPWYVFERIPFTFAPGTRQKYLDGGIRHLDVVTH